ncbi:HAD family hydrolase [Lacinutrix neustonica]|uniref:HAD family hydrolase n=1 Tax=Lacinutrix neustonica TaxID=2980107 RepID=A0A9E8MW27_9FLAO|nr:HAD family hydrolase [Lacinutrix neustonica]WAC02020.1 HAD family hydrolase [Lacinutrix neustonica]
MKDIKLVVTDMDGTLLNSKNEVSSSFFELYRTLKKLDVKFVAASGRQHSSIISKLHAIKDDITIVSENGALIREAEKELLFTKFPMEAIRKLIPTLRKIPNTQIILCGKDAAYIDSNDVHFNSVFKEYYKTHKKVSDLTTIEADDFMKIALYHPLNSEKYIYPALQHLKQEITVKISGTHWVDLSVPTANKGYALDFLQNKWNIQPKHTMAFGDFNNDLEMLELADFSYAMANAHPNVKALANFSTKSNDDLGVEHILKQLIAAKS